MKNWPPGQHDGKLLAGEMDEEEISAMDVEDQDDKKAETVQEPGNGYHRGGSVGVGVGVGRKAMIVAILGVAAMAGIIGGFWKKQDSSGDYLIPAEDHVMSSVALTKHGMMVDDEEELQDGDRHVVSVMADESNMTIVGGAADWFVEEENIEDLADFFDPAESVPRDLSGRTNGSEETKVLNENSHSHVARKLNDYNSLSGPFFILNEYAGNVLKPPRCNHQEKLVQSTLDPYDKLAMWEWSGDGYLKNVGCKNKDYFMHPEASRCKDNIGTETEVEIVEGSDNVEGWTFADLGNGKSNLKLRACDTRVTLYNFLETLGETNVRLSTTTNSESNNWNQIFIAFQPTDAMFDFFYIVNPTSKLAWHVPSCRDGNNIVSRPHLTKIRQRVDQKWWYDEEKKQIRPLRCPSLTIQMETTCGASVIQLGRSSSYSYVRQRFKFSEEDNTVRSDPCGSQLVVHADNMNEGAKLDARFVVDQSKSIFVKTKENDLELTFFILNQYAGSVLAVWDNRCEHHNKVEQRRFDPTDANARWYWDGDKIRSFACPDYIMTVAYQDCEYGRRAEIWSDHDHNSGRWKFEEFEEFGSETMLTSKNCNDRVVDFADRSSAPGRNVQLAGINNNPANNWNQLFMEFYSTDDMIDFFYLVNPTTGYAWDVPDCGHQGLFNEPSMQDFIPGNVNQRWWYDTVKEQIRPLRCPTLAAQMKITCGLSRIELGRSGDYSYVRQRFKFDEEKKTIRTLAACSETFKIAQEGDGRRGEKLIGTSQANTDNTVFEKKRDSDLHEGSFFIGHLHSGNVLAIWGSQCKHQQKLELKPFDPTDHYAKWRWKDNQLESVPCPNYFITPAHADCEWGRDIEIWDHRLFGSNDWASVWEKEGLGKGEALKLISTKCSTERVVRLVPTEPDNLSGRIVKLHDASSQTVGQYWDRQFMEISGNKTSTNDMEDFFYLVNPPSGHAWEIDGSSKNDDNTVEPSLQTFSRGQLNQKWWYDTDKDQIRPYLRPTMAVIMATHCGGGSQIQVVPSISAVRQKFIFRDNMIKEQISNCDLVIHVEDNSMNTGAKFVVGNPILQSSTFFVQLRDADMFSIVNAYYPDGESVRALDTGERCDDQRIETIEYQDKSHQLWWYNKLTSQINSVQCPGKVLDLHGGGCNTYVKLFDVAYEDPPAPAQSWVYKNGALVPSSCSNVLSIEGGSSKHSAEFDMQSVFYGSAPGWYQKFLLTKKPNLQNDGDGNYVNPVNLDPDNIECDAGAENPECIFFCEKKDCPLSGWIRAFNTSKIDAYDSFSHFGMRVDNTEYLYNLFESHNSDSNTPMLEVVVPKGYCVKLFTSSNGRGGSIYFGNEISKTVARPPTSYGFNGYTSSAIMSPWDSSCDPVHQYFKSSENSFFILNQYAGSVLAVWDNRCEHHNKVEQRRFDPTDAYARWYWDGDKIRSFACPDYIMTVAYQDCEYGRRAEIWSDHDHNSGRWEFLHVDSITMLTSKNCNDRVVDFADRSSAPGRNVQLAGINNNPANNWNQAFMEFYSTDDMMDFFYLVNPTTGYAFAVPDCGHQGLFNEPSMQDFIPGNVNQRWWYDTVKEQIRPLRCPTLAVEMEDHCKPGSRIQITTSGIAAKQMFKFDDKDKSIKNAAACPNLVIHVDDMNSGAKFVVNEWADQSDSRFFSLRDEDIFSIVNIFHPDSKGARALDSSSDTCPDGQIVKTIEYEEGKYRQLWWYNEENFQINSVKCPGQVLDVLGGYCNSDSLILQKTDGVRSASYPQSWTYKNGALVLKHCNAAISVVEESADAVSSFNLTRLPNGAPSWRQMFLLTQDDKDVVEDTTYTPSLGFFWKPIPMASNEDDNPDHICLTESTRINCGDSYLYQAEREIDIAYIAEYISEDHYGMLVDNTEYFENLSRSKTNKMKRVIIPKGYCLTLFQEYNGKGASVRFGSKTTETIRYLEDYDFNQKASSFVASLWDSSCTPVDTYIPEPVVDDGGEDVSDGTSTSTSFHQSGIGSFCWKDSYGRGIGTIGTGCPDNYVPCGFFCNRGLFDWAHKTCDGGEENSNGLCYPECRSGYKGNGPVCWGQNPDNWVDCGAFGSARSDMDCASAIGSMVSSVAQSAANIGTAVFSGGTSTAATPATGIWRVTAFLSKLKRDLTNYAMANKVLRALIKIFKYGSPFASVLSKTVQFLVKAEANGWVTPTDVSRLMLGIYGAFDPTGLLSVAASYTHDICGQAPNPPAAVDLSMHGYGLFLFNPERQYNVRIEEDDDFCSNGKRLVAEKFDDDENDDRRDHWRYNEETQAIESIRCPGYVMHVDNEGGLYCSHSSDVRLYQYNGENSQRWIIDNNNGKISPVDCDFALGMFTEEEGSSDDEREVITLQSFDGSGSQIFLGIQREGKDSYMLGPFSYLRDEVPVIQIVSTNPGQDYKPTSALDLKGGDCDENLHGWEIDEDNQNQHFFYDEHNMTIRPRNCESNVLGVDSCDLDSRIKSQLESPGDSEQQWKIDPLAGTIASVGCPGMIIAFNGGAKGAQALLAAKNDTIYLHDRFVVLQLEDHGRLSYEKLTISTFEQNSDGVSMYLGQVSCNSYLQGWSADDNHKYEYLEFNYDEDTLTLQPSSCASRLVTVDSCDIGALVWSKEALLDEPKQQWKIDRVTGLVTSVGCPGKIMVIRGDGINRAYAQLDEIGTRYLHRFEFWQRDSYRYRTTADTHRHDTMIISNQQDREWNIDVPGGLCHNEIPLQVWDDGSYGENWNQHFWYDSNTLTIRSTRCPGMVWGIDDCENGAPVHLYEHTISRNQQWLLDRENDWITSVECGTEVVVGMTNAARGAHVRMWEKDTGNDQQKWTLKSASREIVRFSYNKVPSMNIELTSCPGLLHVSDNTFVAGDERQDFFYDASTLAIRPRSAECSAFVWGIDNCDNGQDVKLVPEDVGNKNQQWTINRDGFRITSVGCDKVAEVAYGGTTSGSKLQIWELKSNQDNQAFTFSPIPQKHYNIYRPDFGDARYSDLEVFQIYNQGVDKNVDVEHGRCVEGNKIHMASWSDGNDHQDFWFDKATQTIRSVACPGMVLGVNQEGTYCDQGDRADVQLQDFNGKVYQKWIVDHHTAKIHPAECHGKVLANEAGQLQIHDDNGASNKRFFVTKMKDIRSIQHTLTGMVLDVQNGNCNNGTSIQLYGHHSSNYNQKFGYDKKTKQIRSIICPGMVLEVSNAGGGDSYCEEGRELQLWTSIPESYNQMWDFDLRGRLVVLGCRDDMVVESYELDEAYDPIPGAKPVLKHNVDTTWTQKWNTKNLTDPYDDDDVPFQIYNEGANKTLSAMAFTCTRTAHGSEVQSGVYSESCTGLTDKSWTSGECHNQQLVRLWSAPTDSSQNFVYNSETQFITFKGGCSYGGQYVLDVSLVPDGDHCANGQEVHIHEKHGGDNQKFVLNLDGTISLATCPEYVVEIAGYSKEDGARIQVWERHNFVQEFSMV